MHSAFFTLEKPGYGLEFPAQEASCVPGRVSEVQTHSLKSPDDHPREGLTKTRSVPEDALAGHSVGHVSVVGVGSCMIER